VQSGWTQVFAQDGNIRDGFRVAYKVAGAGEPVTQAAYSSDGIEGSATIFQYNGVSSGIGTPSISLDMGTPSYTANLVPPANGAVIGVAVGMGGVAPTVTGVTAPASIRTNGGRAGVTPFFTTTAATVTATVPATQESARFAFISIPITLT
jgi:hypothetical protein